MLLNLILSIVGPFIKCMSMAQFFRFFHPKKRIHRTEPGVVTVNLVRCQYRDLNKPFWDVQVSHYRVPLRPADFLNWRFHCPSKLPPIPPPVPHPPSPRISCQLRETIKTAVFNFSLWLRNCMRNERPRTYNCISILVYTCVYLYLCIFIQLHTQLNAIGGRWAAVLVKVSRGWISGFLYCCISVFVFLYLCTGGWGLVDW